MWQIFGRFIPNPEQIKSSVRWAQATIGPFIIANGYASASQLEMVAGIIISLAPWVWGMFTHTETNAVVVVDTLAKNPESGVKAVLTDQTPAGRELAAAIPGNTTVVSGTAAASSLARAA